MTQGYRNAGTTNRAPGWPQDVPPKACARCPAKDCETTSATDSLDDLRFAKDDPARMIYACHVLEQFGRTKYKADLQEWRRVLKVGGLQRLSVPDFRSCANNLLRKKSRRRPQRPYLVS